MSPAVWYLISVSIKPVYLTNIPCQKIKCKVAKSGKSIDTVTKFCCPVDNILSTSDT